MITPSPGLHPDVYELAEALAETYNNALEELPDDQLEAFAQESKRQRAAFRDAVLGEMGK